MPTDWQQIYSEIANKLASTAHAADVDFENIPRISYKSILHILGTFEVKCHQIDNRFEN